MFSLDLKDEEVTSYMAEFLRENPRRLHEAVAGGRSVKDVRVLGAIGVVEMAV